jgi:hypothetical protein
MLSLWNWVQSAGEGLELCAFAASVNHSGAIANIKPAIENDVVCFL